MPGQMRGDVSGHARPRQRGRVVSPSLDDPNVRALSEGAGGPMGEHGGRHPWWTPVRVVLALTAICFALGMIKDAPCYQAKWGDANTNYSHMCYSDLPYLYTGRGFAELHWPYLDDESVRARYPAMEYPVVISYWAWWAAKVAVTISGSPDVSARAGVPVDSLGADPEIRTEMLRFVAVNAVGFAALALLAAWLLAGVDPRRPWDAAFFALSPALALAGLVNWDMLAVACVAAALWAWSRGRPVLTGAMVGLGVATKLYPLFLLGGLLVICVRERRFRELGQASAATAVTWLLVNAPAYLSGVDDWKAFWQFNSGRTADLGSVWLLLDQRFDWSTSASTINLWSWLIFGAWCAGVLVVGLLAPATPRLAQLGFLVVAGFLLVNKVYSPQYVLWLLPLAALARPRLRDQVVWQGCEILYFASVWWYLGNFLAPAGGGDSAFYWFAILIRIAGQLYLVAIVVRDIMDPRHDPTRDLGWFAYLPRRLEARFART
jgi:uncharacterized membrane protein